MDITNKHMVLIFLFKNYSENVYINPNIYINNIYYLIITII